MFQAVKAYVLAEYEKEYRRQEKLAIERFHAAERRENARWNRQAKRRRWIREKRRLIIEALSTATTTTATTTAKVRPQLKTV